jgi:hypothetical protein
METEEIVTLTRLPAPKGGERSFIQSDYGDLVILPGRCRLNVVHQDYGLIDIPLDAPWIQIIPPEPGGPLYRNRQR